MYTPRRSAIWLRSLGDASARPCGISTEFCGDQYSVLFHLFAKDVPAMPRGLHARLCHAFLAYRMDRCRLKLRSRHALVALVVDPGGPNIRSDTNDRHDGPDTTARYLSAVSVVWLVCASLD